MANYITFPVIGALYRQEVTSQFDYSTPIWCMRSVKTSLSSISYTSKLFRGIDLESQHAGGLGEFRQLNTIFRNSKDAPLAENSSTDAETEKIGPHPSPARPETMRRKEKSRHIWSICNGFWFCSVEIPTFSAESKSSFQLPVPALTTVLPSTIPRDRHNERARIIQ